MSVRILRKINSPVPAKRVLRHKNQFVCGACRDTFATHEEAQWCLEKCIQEVFKKEPFLLHRHEGKNYFRCNFCKRDFEDASVALSCAKECKDNFLDSFHAEKKLLENGFEAIHPHQGVAIGNASQIYRKPKVVVQNVQQNTAANNSILQDLIKDPMMEQKSSSPSNTGPKMMKKSQLRDPKAEKFHRDGANYICNDCGKDYFTKVEVVKCYDVHGEDLIEVDADGHPVKPLVQPKKAKAAA